MTLIKSILENEIKDVLGHIPTQIEYKSALEYLNDNVSKKDFLVNISTALNDWRHDCCVQCKNCEDYFLPEEMYYEDFCSDYCKTEWAKEQEAEEDFRRECQSRWNER